MKVSIGRRVGALETRIVGGAELAPIVFIGVQSTDCQRAGLNGRAWTRSQGEAVADFEARVMKDWEDQLERPLPSGGVAFGPTFS